MAHDANIDESGIQAEVIEDNITANIDDGIITSGEIVSAIQNGSSPAIEADEIRASVIDPGGGSSGVSSVNGRVGDVLLAKSDVSLENVDNVRQYSASNPPPYPVASVNGQTGAVQISFGKSDVGLGNVDNVRQYSASNPPPYPVASVLDAYPVGSIYMSVSSTDPGTLFGGTWERLKDTFLLGAGTTYNAGDTGGSATNSHTHSLGSNGYAKIMMYTQGGVISYREKSGVTAWAQNFKVTPGSGSGSSASGNCTYAAELGGKTGSESDNNNMPPYLVVYMWKRTA